MRTNLERSLTHYIADRAEWLLRCARQQPDDIQAHILRERAYEMAMLAGHLCDMGLYNTILGAIAGDRYCAEGLAATVRETAPAD